MSVLPMRGPSQVRHLVRGWLEADLPTRIKACRAAWGLEPERLPMPERYDPHEPLVLDRYPVVSVVTARHRAEPLADLTEAGEYQWRVGYPVRVYAWVAGRTVEETFDLRDDYLTVLQVSLAASRSLGGAGGGNLLVVPPLEVDFSGIEPTQSTYIAGGYVAFSLRATETLSSGLAYPESPPGRTVSSVTVDAAVLPTTAADLGDLYPRPRRLP